jgi:predicted nucleic acid-binding protein
MKNKTQRMNLIVLNRLYKRKREEFKKLEEEAYAVMKALNKRRDLRRRKTSN